MGSQSFSFVVASCHRLWATGPYGLRATFECGVVLPCGCEKYTLWGNGLAFGYRHGFAQCSPKWVYTVATHRGPKWMVPMDWVGLADMAV